MKLINALTFFESFSKNTQVAHEKSISNIEVEVDFKDNKVLNWGPVKNF